jgi:hypothetical protein
MYHSVYFSDDLNNLGPTTDETAMVNSYEDLHLVSQVRPYIVPPSVKTKYVDIPGGDGSIDLTDSLTGRPAYNNREGSLEFLILNDYVDWDDEYHTLLKWFHGRKFKLGLEDEMPNATTIPWYYGRLAVNGYTPGSSANSSWSKVKLDYKLEPYRQRFVEMQHFTATGENTLTTTMNVPDISDSSGLVASRFTAFPALAVRCNKKHKITVLETLNRILLYEGIIEGDGSAENYSNLPKVYLDLDWSLNFKEGYAWPSQYEIVLENLELEDNDVDVYFYSLVKEI